MADRPGARLARLYLDVRDLLPRAMAAPDPVADPAVRPPTVDPGWRRTGTRYVVPQPDRLDHWESAAAGEPYLFFDVAGPSAVGLQVETLEGVRRLRGLLRPSGAPRLASLLEAAARCAGAETALLAVRRDARGVLRERIVDGRRVATDALGPEVLAALLDGADRAAVALPAGEEVALRLALVDVPEDDRVAVRREAKRLVALWRAVWGLPPVDPPPAAKAELDKRLAAAYRRSLRLVAGRVGPAERAALRVEVRTLREAYRSVGLARPRLLDVLTARLGLEPSSEAGRRQ